MGRQVRRVSCGCCAVWVEQGQPPHAGRQTPEAGWEPGGSIVSCGMMKRSDGLIAYHSTLGRPVWRLRRLGCRKVARHFLFQFTFRSRYDRLNKARADGPRTVCAPRLCARLSTAVQCMARVKRTSRERSQTMARMVLGLATSHSPQLSLPAEHWLTRGEEDRLNQSLYRVPNGTHVTFDEL